MLITRKATAAMTMTLMKHGRLLGVKRATNILRFLLGLKWLIQLYVILPVLLIPLQSIKIFTVMTLTAFFGQTEAQPLLTLFVLLLIIMFMGTYFGREQMWEDIRHMANPELFFREIK